MNDRPQLPLLAGSAFITDGGMETTLIFQQGVELPEFASFVLLDDAQGKSARGRDAPLRCSTGCGPSSAIGRRSSSAAASGRAANGYTVGGCCGTDDTHVREICDAVLLSG